MKADIDVPEELVNEIVEEILAETQSKSPSKKSKSPESLLDDMPDDAKLKTRLQYLENRLEKHVHDYKIGAVEVERQIADKFSEFEKHNEKQLIYMQGQLEALRTAMIRLSNELRQSKGQTSQ